MKKFFVTLAISLLVVSQMFAMSTRKVRETARFLSDRMAWELDMTPQQYDDCYEINYDFIFAINPIMDDIVRGYNYAIDSYYTFLDYRNDDFRYILNEVQYRRFLELEYFYRPIYTYRGDWFFRIYQIYNNPKFFYFDAPTIYKHYSGAHARHHYADGFYGHHRHYTHKIYSTPHHIRGSSNMNGHSRMDFGNNRREKGAKQSMNGYNNRNQNDREKDNRYKDERKGKNKNSPQINNRQSGHSSTRSSGSSNQGSSKSGSTTSGSGHQHSGHRR